MKHNYSDHQVESFIKTLIVGGILGSAITMLVQMFSGN